MNSLSLYSLHLLIVDMISLSLFIEEINNLPLIIGENTEVAYEYLIKYIYITI